MPRKSLIRLCLFVCATVGLSFAAISSPTVSVTSAQSCTAPMAGLVARYPVSLTGAKRNPVNSDSLGCFSFHGLLGGGSYSVTGAPPADYSANTIPFANLSANQKTANLTALATVTISGRLTNVNGRGLGGETVNLTGSATASTQTDSTGAYSFAVTSGGDYTVTPGDPRVNTWSPLNSITHNNLTQNISNDNFEARFPSFTVSGILKNGSGTNLAGVTVRLTGTVIIGSNKVNLRDYSTDSNGAYTSDQLNILGDYTFTPQQSTVGGITYGTFTPSSRSFNSITPCNTVPGATCDNNTSTNNYLGADFTASPIQRILTIASTNPASGVSIMVSPNDVNNAGNGTTQFTRTYNNNQVVNLTASATASGNNFQKWLKDGVDFANNTTSITSVTMDADHTMTAVYATPMTIQFDSSVYTAAENIGSKIITVTRSGVPSGAATVNYATSDAAGANPCSTTNGVASSRCDYTTTLGTLNFGPGETSKTFLIAINDDAYAEGNEIFNITLSNATGAALGTPSTATVMITNDDMNNGANPLNDSRYFVRMHYVDFLNREPDTSGWDFWTGQTTNCGSADLLVCRINVSASFFQSIEFQQTGFLVERTYKVSYGDVDGLSTFPSAHPLKVPVIRFNEFLGDTQQITKGVIVLQTGWEQLLENNKVAFFADFVQRQRFTTAYPTTKTPAEFVDALNTNAGGNVLSASERQTAINLFGGAVNTTNQTARAQAVRMVAEDPDLFSAESNRAFVLMQYFGYLRRNPNDPQDSDYSGYDFWLTKLNQFGGNYINAEMVKAFITSTEYLRRFGP